MTPRLVGLVAAIVAATMSSVELIRLLVTRGTVPATAPLATDALSMGCIAVLAASAIGLASGRRFGWDIGAIAAVVAVGHAVVSISTGARLPAIYIPGGFAMLLLLGQCAAYYREPRVPPHEDVGSRPNVIREGTTLPS